MMDHMLRIRTAGEGFKIYIHILKHCFVILLKQINLLYESVLHIQTLLTYKHDVSHKDLLCAW